MTFLHPLGLLALVAVPIVVALSLWRWRRRHVEVSSLLLWRDVAVQWRETPHARRRRLDPLIIVRIAVALVLAAAIAGPAWVSTVGPARHLVLILDRSASMATVDTDEQSRWHKARRELLTLLGRLNQADRVDVVAVPSPVERPIPPALGASDAAALLQELSPSDAAVEPGQLAQTAIEVARRYPGAATVVVTDALLPGLPAGVSVLAVGAPARNLGIVAFAARPAQEGRAQVLVAVASSDASPASTPVVLLADGQPLGERAVAVPLRGRAQAIFDVALAPEARVLEARLGGADGLAADDRAWLARRPGGVRVAWIGDDDRYLRRALAAQPGVTLTDLPQALSDGVPSGYDLALYCRAVPRELAGGTIVLVAPRDSVGALRLGGDVEAGEGTVVAPRDPLMTAVRLDGIALGRIRGLSTPQGFETLAAGAGGVPLIGRWAEGQARVIYVAIDPAASDWPLKPSFPIFWANVVASVGGLGGGEFRAVPPGQLCRVDWAGPEAELIKPGGARRRLRGGVCRPEHVGLYRVASDGREQAVAVSLLSPAETQAEGAGTELPSEFLDQRQEGAGERSVWRLGGLAALFALALVAAHGWLSGRSRGF